MARASLTGTRVRERRIAQGRKQGDLARAVGISPSYLNLIEHNRRRIGGKLVHALARELEVEPTALTEGAGAGLLDALREAAQGRDAAPQAQDDLEEFASRYPIWAELLVETARRAQDLERMVEVLSDRMTHDPYLSTSVHEVLSTVTAIRSTAAILVETPDIDVEWRHRFHRNLEEDAARLAGSAEALVRYLDAATDPETLSSTAAEEFDAWLQTKGYHIAQLETLDPVPVQAVVAASPGLQSQAARALAVDYLDRYAADAARMPMRGVLAAIKRLGCDPAALAEAFEVDLATAFRRLAAVPASVFRTGLGLAACDGSGFLTFRKPIAGFDLPRHAAACPMWPLFEALAHPMTPIRRQVATAGRSGARFVTFAICQPRRATGFNQPPILEATMLIVPPDLVPEGQSDALYDVGISCRICPRAECAARREPSLISEPAGQDASAAAF